LEVLVVLQELSQAFQVDLLQDSRNKPNHKLLVDLLMVVLEVLDHFLVLHQLLEVILLQAD